MYSITPIPLDIFGCYLVETRNVGQAETKLVETIEMSSVWLDHVVLSLVHFIILVLFSSPEHEVHRSS